MSNPGHEPTASLEALAPRRRARCLIVGTCTGLPELLHALAGDESVELVRLRNGGMAAEQFDSVLLAARDEHSWFADYLELRAQTKAPVVLVTAKSSPAMLDQALEAGIQDVHVVPAPAENVAFSIRRASQTPLHAERDASLTHGRVATVFSPKGGTGKTVIATSLAVTLASQRQRTLLIDLDLQFGDAAILLGLTPERTISDLFAAPGELTAEKLSGYVAQHAAGLDVLAAPVRPENADLVADEELATVIEVARSVYDVVVIDTAPLFQGAVLTAVDWTDVLLLVCSPDIASLKNVHLGLHTLSLLTYPTERIRLILNHAHDGSGLKTSEVQNALRMQIAHEVPFDRSVRSALNRGIPPVVANPGSGVAAAIKNLAAEIRPVPRAAAPRRRFSFIGRS